MQKIKNPKWQRTKFGLWFCLSEDAKIIIAVADLGGCSWCLSTHKNSSILFHSGEARGHACHAKHDQKSPE